MEYWSWVKVRLFERFSHTVRNHDILPIKRDKCETFGSASVKAITIIQKPSLELSSKHIWKWYYIVLNIRQQYFFFAFYFYKVNLLHSRFRLIKRTIKHNVWKILENVSFWQNRQRSELDSWLGNNFRAKIISSFLCTNWIM